MPLGVIKPRLLFLVCETDLPNLPARKRSSFINTHSHTHILYIRVQYTLLR